MTLDGAGHLPQRARPGAVNLLMREFLDAPAPPAPRAAGRARAARPRRALYISSPIGLGHARRDVAIADELRALHPDLEIDWLAQHPVTAVLERARRADPPASAQLASESGHIESRGGRARPALLPGAPADGRDPARQLHGLPRPRRDERYDLWIGDEAWELDYFLHENPELKTAAYAWLTDFVGWLPMPDGGEREALLTADYNAEMIEQIARFPRVRDRAIFVGEPDDVVPDALRPGPAGDPRVDRAALRLLRLRHRLRPADARATATRCARELGYGARRARLHRHRRRLGRRRARCCGG